jgi:hypothetical protein
MLEKCQVYDSGRWNATFGSRKTEGQPAYLQMVARLPSRFGGRQRVPSVVCVE